MKKRSVGFGTDREKIHLRTVNNLQEIDWLNDWLIDWLIDCEEKNVWEVKKVVVVNKYMDGRFLTRL